MIIQVSIRFITHCFPYHLPLKKTKISINYTSTHFYHISSFPRIFYNTLHFSRFSAFKLNRKRFRTQCHGSHNDAGILIWLWHYIIKSTKAGQYLSLIWLWHYIIKSIKAGKYLSSVVSAEPKQRIKLSHKYKYRTAGMKGNASTSITVETSA
jgi:hypothetical protein